MATVELRKDSPSQVAHQDFAWELRKDPRVTGVFEALWGTSALLTSFDR